LKALLGWSQIEPPNYFEAAGEVLDALPEIIAVVEAMESHIRDDERYQRRLTMEHIKDALAALGAKLTGTQE